MTGRAGHPSAFRAAPAAAPAGHPSRRQAVALLAVLVLVSGVVAVLSYLVRPDRARAFELFRGSLFLSDQLGPVAVDLPSGTSTLRLVGADEQVGITNADVLEPVPLTDHTLLLNQTSGEFNIVDNNGFIVKHDGSGVPLPPGTGPTTAMGFDAGDGQAYVVRTDAGGTDVYLVNQATVEAAISATARPAQPRASGSMRETVSTGPGGATSANGDLWLLVQRPGISGARTIRQLRVPPNSSTGAILVPSDHGFVDGPAAIGTTGAGAAGSGKRVVGVAAVSSINLFGAAAGTPAVTYPAPAGVDTILPTATAHDRLAFLMHGRAAWYLVSVNADGTDLRMPTRLDGIPRDADLAEPTASNGHVYTIDRSTGALYEIGYDATSQSVPGRSSYPVMRQIEEPDYRDAYVTARGPRVVFNSPTHSNALMVFTDGTHKPRTIAKSNAVHVNAAGGAEALTHSNVPVGQDKPPKPQAPKPKPKPAIAPPITPPLNCQTTAVTPHIPAITSAVPGSRTVMLTWHYPVISPQDCLPSTSLLSISTVCGGAPQPPPAVRVQSQTGKTISGLFPSTKYNATVTAYINGQGTESLPASFSTGEEGPAAPTGLAVTADSTGTWKLNWDSCGTVDEGCVPVQSWTITPSFCDHRSVAVPPTPLTLTADPTSKRQPTATYGGTDDLLGRGLRFQVIGTGTEGQAGRPSASSACVYSWAPPVAADLNVQASTPPQAAGAGHTTTTIARVTFANGAVHDLGGVGGTLTYQLRQGTGVVASVGPTRDTSVTLPGILAGRRYQVKVLASPPRHPEVVAEVGPVDVVPAVASWPTLLIDEPTFDAPPGQSGTLHVGFRFRAGTVTRGETFQLVNSQLRCGGGNLAMTLTAADVAPGDDLTFPVDRTVFRGPCTVVLQLAQDPRTATDPPLYGAGTSRARTSPTFQIDPPSITSTADDFQAQWGGTNENPTVVVTYHGSDDLSGAHGWQLTLSRGGVGCGNAQNDAPPVTIDVDKSCIADGDGAYSVHIQYTYFLVSHAQFDVPVAGQAASAVDPSQLSFTAQWNDNPQMPQVLLDYTGSEPPNSLAPLDWTEMVTSTGSPGVVCASDHDTPGNATIRIADVLAACPAIAGPDGELPSYSVEVSFTDPNYGQTGDYPTPVSGTPPQ